MQKAVPQVPFEITASSHTNKINKMIAKDVYMYKVIS